MKTVHVLLAPVSLNTAASCKKEFIDSGHVIIKQQQAGSFHAITDERSMKAVIKTAPTKQVELVGIKIATGYTNESPGAISSEL